MLADANPADWADAAELVPVVARRTGHPHTRSRAHYRDGHIPPAVNADLDSQLAASPSREAVRHLLPTIEELSEGVAVASSGLPGKKP